MGAAIGAQAREGKGGVKAKTVFYLSHLLAQYKIWQYRPAHVAFNIYAYYRPCDPVWLDVPFFYNGVGCPD